MKLIEFVRDCLNNPPAVLSLSAALSPSQVSLSSLHSSPETQLVPAPRTEERSSPSPESALLTLVKDYLSAYTSVYSVYKALTET